MRIAILSNGNMLIGIDEHGQIRDFCWPYISQENHVFGHRHKMGVFVEGNFSWLFSDEWKKSFSYEENSLVLAMKARNEKLNVEIETEESIYHEKNIYLKKIKVKNLEGRGREIRLFLNQHFHITGANIGDTAYYLASEKAIIFYKGKRYFLISGRKENGYALDDYATGMADLPGYKGTYVDAEDGVLSKNTIEHGSVDSTIAFHLQIKASSEQIVYYWICAGEKYKDVRALTKFILARDFESL